MEIEDIISAIIGATAVLVTFLISSFLDERRGRISAASEHMRHQQSHESKMDELFMTALNFLEGGTQKRNVGIAAISLYLQQEQSKHIQLCRELLIGAAIYLLCESEQNQKTHEIYNLKRIMKLILKHVPTNDKSHEEYQELKKVLKNWEFKSGKDKGLHLNQETVDKWRDELSVEYDKSAMKPSSQA